MTKPVDGAPAPRKRGPKPKPPEELAIASRKNVSLDTEAQQALVQVQEKLAGEFGFKPTLTQVVLWLIRKANKEQG